MSRSGESASGQPCSSCGHVGVIPVDDLQSQEAREIFLGREREILLRLKLATLYRIIDRFGWTQGIFNHITVRLSPDEFLINPFGLKYHEITAGSLVKVNGDGAIINQGTTRLGINKAGYVLHSAIHAGRPDIQCVIHVHTDVGAAVSALKCGLLPISQEALTLGEISYHNYNGILVDEAERKQIIESLGPKNMVMVLRNHGLVALGRTIEEALPYLFNTVKACETQVHLPCGGSVAASLTVPGKAVMAQVVAVQALGGGGVSSIAWAPGELEFEALVRELHATGCATGLTLKSDSFLNVGLQRDNHVVE